MKKYNIILIFLIILLLLFIYSNYNYNCNNFSNVSIVDSWLNKNSFLDLFNYIFKNCTYNVIIYTNFDTLNIDNNNDNTLNIQYSGESYYNNPNDYNINFIPLKPNETNNIIIFPYGYLHLLYMNLNINYLINNRIYNKKQKFCLFIVSNGSCWQRNDFFDKLSKYKKVDSYGNYLNNMNSGINYAFGSEEYLNIIKDYKFMICFENKSCEYYLTEKLINAYYGKTIPIYWGCPQTTEWINTDSLIYINPEYDEHQVNNIINEIIMLDNDDNLYKQKYEQSFFKNGQQPDEFNIDKIKEKVELLLETNKIIYKK